MLIFPISRSDNIYSEDYSMEPDLIQVVLKSTSLTHNFQYWINYVMPFLSFFARFSSSNPIYSIVSQIREIIVPNTRESIFHYARQFLVGIFSWIFTNFTFWARYWFVNNIFWNNLRLWMDQVSNASSRR